jgi:hypothetical protein
MGKNTRFLGLDVHAETIAVAVAEGRHRVRSLGAIANRAEAVRRLLGKLGKLDNLRNVCDRRLREAGLARGEKHVTGCASPLYLGRQWYAHDGAEGAAVQGVALNDKNRSPEPRTRTDRIAEVCPAHPSPWAITTRSSPELLVRGTLKRGVRFALEFCANAIERVGDRVRRMPRDKLSQGFGLQVTARNLEPLRKMLGLVKDLIRNGHGRLHTKSITRRTVLSSQNPCFRLGSPALATIHTDQPNPQPTDPRNS